MPDTRQLLVEQVNACAECRATVTENVALVLPDSGVLPDQQVAMMLVYVKTLHEAHGRVAA